MAADMVPQPPLHFRRQQKAAHSSRRGTSDSENNTQSEVSPTRSLRGYTRTGAIGALAGRLETAAQLPARQGVANAAAAAIMDVARRAFRP